MKCTLHNAIHKNVSEFQPQYVFLCSSTSSLFEMANPASSHWRIRCSASTCRRFTPTSTLQFLWRPGRDQPKYTLVFAQGLASSTGPGNVKLPHMDKHYKIRPWANRNLQSSRILLKSLKDSRPRTLDSKTPSYESWVLSHKLSFLEILELKKIKSESRFYST